MLPVLTNRLAVTGLVARHLRIALSGVVAFGLLVAAAADAALPDHPIHLSQPAAAVPPAPPPPPPPEFAFAEPVAGHDVGSPFGLRQLPWEEGGRLHEGVDIAAPSGSQVACTLDGVVTRQGTSASYGRFVEVKHKDGLTSFYAHLSRQAKGVAPGVAVAAGQTVGYVGDTGHSTGPHLHFEIRKAGRPLNPALLMGHAFATFKDLPLRAAGRVPGHVRLAQVSGGARWAHGAAKAHGGRVHMTVNLAE